MQHLPTLFRRIQQGEIRVPAFQRGFVWGETQILQLLESVYRGFPIGSLLFWSVKEQLLRIEHSAAFPFPDTIETYPLKFLLDGLQRLSTLYGVFHWPEPDVPNHYNVVFDLEAEEFKHFNSELPLNKAIPLSALFSPKVFLEAQRALTSDSNSEILIERAIRLHSVFQEYMVPTVTIENRSVPDVVAMFERINSTGTKLNAVDFMRAVTWSPDFDLNTEIGALHKELELKNFEVPVETLVKALAVVVGKMPTGPSMLELRGTPAIVLRDAVYLLRSIVDDARVFLRQRFEIQSYDYLPYEGQFLMLVRFIQRGGMADLQMTQQFEEWLWATSFNEELRGKPDHYVARMLARLENLLTGDMRALRTRLVLTFEDLLERRFIRGKALSAAFACMFARHQARSLVTGELIPPELYMQEFSTKNFVGLIEGNELIAAFGREFPSNKILANTFLLTEDDLLVVKGMSGREIFANCIAKFGDRAGDILYSQFVLPNSVGLLEDNKIENFLMTRASLIAANAGLLVDEDAFDDKG